MKISVLNALVHPSQTNLEFMKQLVVLLSVELAALATLMYQSQANAAVTACPLFAITKADNTFLDKHGVHQVNIKF